MRRVNKMDMTWYDENNVKSALVWWWARLWHYLVGRLWLGFTRRHHQTEGIMLPELNKCIYIGPQFGKTSIDSSLDKVAHG